MHRKYEKGYYCSFTPVRNTLLLYRVAFEVHVLMYQIYCTCTEYLMWYQNTQHTSLQCPSIFLFNSISINLHPMSHEQQRFLNPHTLAPHHHHLLTSKNRMTRLHRHRERSDLFFLEMSPFFISPSPTQREAHFISLIIR